MQRYFWNFAQSVDLINFINFLHLFVLKYYLEKYDGKLIVGYFRFRRCSSGFILKIR